MDDYMIDFETFGTRPGCVVLSLGAVFFDASGLDARRFDCAVSVASQEALGLHRDPDTEAWWNRQSEEARKTVELALAPDAPSLDEMLCNFSEFLRQHATKRKTKIWGNGASFDNAILAELYRRAAIASPWEYWNDRCYRTLKNLYKGIEAPERKGIHHNALDDAVFQAEHAVKILHFKSRLVEAAQDTNSLNEYNLEKLVRSLESIEKPIAIKPTKVIYKRKF
jgi:3' exoribonuclease, RNase T-like